MNEIWKHCLPPGIGPVTYNRSGVALGWLFTCPYCLTQIDSHHYAHDIDFEFVCSTHLKACRDHNQSNAVKSALAQLTDITDREGRPMYHTPGVYHE